MVDRYQHKCSPPFKEIMFRKSLILLRNHNKKNHRYPSLVFSPHKKTNSRCSAFLRSTSASQETPTTATTIADKANTVVVVADPSQETLWNDKDITTFRTLDGRLVSVHHHHEEVNSEKEGGVMECCPYCLCSTIIKMRSRRSSVSLITAMQHRQVLKQQQSCKEDDCGQRGARDHSVVNNGDYDDHPTLAMIDPSVYHDVQ